MMTRYRINFVRKLLIIFLLFGVIPLKSYAEVCEKLRYEIQDMGIDHELNATMGKMIALYREERNEEIIELYENYRGSAIWVVEHFVRLATEDRNVRSGYSYLYSPYMSKNFSAYSAVINALLLAHGLSFQDKRADLSAKELLELWAGTEDPDHVKLAAQVHASNHFGGFKKTEEDVNYGSSLAHLRFLSERLGLEIAERYVPQIESAIRSFENNHKLKLLNDVKITEKFLLQCNSK